MAIIREIKIVLSRLPSYTGKRIIRGLIGRPIMRTTIVLDDELLEKAQALTQVQEKSALVKEALKALIERESAKRLANLGGSEPQLEAIPRRQTSK